MEVVLTLNKEKINEILMNHITDPDGLEYRIEEPPILFFLDAEGRRTEGAIFFQVKVSRG